MRKRLFCFLARRGVLAVAVFADGYVYSLAAALASVFFYNFFFTSPRMSLKVFNFKYLVTFVLMLSIGLAVSALTHFLKRRMCENTRIV